MHAREPRAVPIARIPRFHWTAAWRYRALVVGCLLAAPLTVLVDTIAPPLIVARVLDRLSRGDYQPDRLWASFHLELTANAVVVFLGFVVTWRVADAFLRRLAGVSSATWPSAASGTSSTGRRTSTPTTSAARRSPDDQAAGQLHPDRRHHGVPAGPADLHGRSIVAIMSVRAPVFAAALAMFAVAFVVVAVFVSRPVCRIGAEHAATDSAQTGNWPTRSPTSWRSRRSPGSPTSAGGLPRPLTAPVIRCCGCPRARMRQMAWFGSLTGATPIGAFVVATDGVVSRGAEIGTMFLIVSYPISAVQQLLDFSSSGLRTYNRAFGDAADMLAVLERESEIRDPLDPEPARIHAGEVRFDRVVFRHAGSREALFDGLSLRIAPGERVGLVGHSGAGKTSVTRLLLRFSDLHGGRILLDGQDIARITQADLRAAIAYVPQEPLLFHRSISENIAYSRLGATPAEIALAATRANVTQFVEELPDGFGTMVGERGVTLSGGQPAGSPRPARTGNCWNTRTGSTRRSGPTSPAASWTVGSSPGPERDVPGSNMFRAGNDIPPGVPANALCDKARVSIAL